jgi:hypothetical protein
MDEAKIIEELNKKNIILIREKLELQNEIYKQQLMQENGKLTEKLNEGTAEKYTVTIEQLINWSQELSGRYSKEDLTEFFEEKLKK